MRETGNISEELASFSGILTEKLGRRIVRDKIINVLRVFGDLKILTYHKLGDVVQITLLETEKGKKGIDLHLPLDLRRGRVLFTHGTPGEPYHLVQPIEVPALIETLCQCGSNK